MKILFVSSSSGSRGGGELYLCILAEALAQNGVQVGLWASSHPRMDELCQRFSQVGDVLRAPYVNTYDRPLRCIPIPTGGGLSQRIREQLSEWKPDVIHLNKQNLEDGLDLMRLIGDCGFPGVCTVHLTQTPSVLGARFAMLRDLSARRALGAWRRPYVCVSESRAAPLRLFCPGQDTVVIPNGVAIPDAAEIAKQRRDVRGTLGLGPEDSLVVAIGRFVEQKRPLLFLEKAIQIKKVRPRTKFLWVGALPDSDFLWVGKSTHWKGRDLKMEWHDRVQREGLEGSVILKPWAENVSPYLAAADWYFHTAKYEGLPFTLLEAMGAGVPVAVTRALADEVGFLNRENALFFDDGPDWAAAFSATDTNRQRAEAARRLVHSHYCLAEMARAYEALYEREIRSFAALRSGDTHRAAHVQHQLF